MFICAVGNHPTKSGEKCTKVVTEKRIREYPSRAYFTLEGELLHDGGGTGWEIIKEEKRCPEHINS